MNHSHAAEIQPLSSLHCGRELSDSLWFSLCVPGTRFPMTSDPPHRYLFLDAGQLKTHLFDNAYNCYRCKVIELL